MEAPRHARRPVLSGQAVQIVVHLRATSRRSRCSGRQRRRYGSRLVKPGIGRHEGNAVTLEPGGCLLEQHHGLGGRGKAAQHHGIHIGFGGGRAVGPDHIVALDAGRHVRIGDDQHAGVFGHCFKRLIVANGLLGLAGLEAFQTLGAARRTAGSASASLRTWSSSKPRATSLKLSRRIETFVSGMHTRARGVRPGANGIEIPVLRPCGRVLRVCFQPGQVFHHPGGNLTAIGHGLDHRGGARDRVSGGIDTVNARETAFIDAGYSP